MSTPETLLHRLRAAWTNAAAILAQPFGAPAAPALVPVYDARKVGRMAGRATLLASALATSAFVAPAHAWWNDQDSWSNGRLVDVQIRVAGRTAPLFWSPSGDERRYFQAFAGRNYSIVLRNDTGQRVAVLLSVDGLNAVNGERTSLSSNEPMYVLSPYETATIQGWRTSLDEVRRFVFVDEQRSYAERTGQANGDMGWIRVLTFREQQPVAWWNTPDVRRWGGPRAGYRDNGGSTAPAPEADRRQSSNAPETVPAPSEPQAQSDGRELAKGHARAYNFDDNLGKDESNGFPGTGWGQRANDHVRQVEFRPEYAATDHLVFRYEYESGLRALGIFTDDRDRLRDRDNGQLGFARPPRW